MIPTEQSSPWLQPLDLRPRLDPFVRHLESLQHESSKDHAESFHTQQPSVSLQDSDGGLRISIRSENACHHSRINGLTTAQVKSVAKLARTAIIALISNEGEGDELTLRVLSVDGPDAIPLLTRENSGTSIVALDDQLVWLERDGSGKPSTAMRYRRGVGVELLHSVAASTARLSLVSCTERALLLAEHSPAESTYTLVEFSATGVAHSSRLPHVDGRQYVLSGQTVWAMSQTGQEIIRFPSTREGVSPAAMRPPNQFLATKLRTRDGALVVEGRVRGNAAVWLPELDEYAFWSAPSAGVIAFRGFHGGSPMFLISSPAVSTRVQKGALSGGWSADTERADQIAVERLQNIPGAVEGVSATVFSLRRPSQTQRKSPLLAIIYGSYGIPNEGTFDPMLASLIRAGISIAFCHVRGGGEFGPSWHESGRGQKKTNSLRDFETLLLHFHSTGEFDPEAMAVSGASAGALLAARAALDLPDIVRAIYLNRPFLAPELDLVPTAHEALQQDWKEFGTPSRRYNPYHRFSPMARLTTALPGRRPPVWITAGRADRKAPP